MFYLESLSEPDSNFTIYLLSTFDPIFSDTKSGSDDSESDCSSVFMNLDILYFRSSK